MRKVKAILQEEVTLSTAQDLNEAASTFVYELTVVKGALEIRIFWIYVRREVVVGLDIEHIAQFSEELCFEIIFGYNCLA